jgi:hypothetical protein
MTQAEKTVWCACGGATCTHEREEYSWRCLNVATTTRGKSKIPLCQECARHGDNRLARFTMGARAVRTRRVR